MCRIGGRLRNLHASEGGAILEIPPFPVFGSNPSETGTVPGGQFNWGGCLPKCNGGAQRFPQDGWKSSSERIGIRELDCEAYKPSRDESRAK